MEMENLWQKEVLKRLNIIINLLLNQVEHPESQISMVERIRYLSSTGLPPAEIGRVVGKPTNYVGAVLSRAKKEEKGKRRG